MTILDDTPDYVMISKADLRAETIRRMETATREELVATILKFVDTCQMSTTRRVLTSA